MANKKRRCACCKKYFDADSGIIQGAQFFANKDHLIEYATSNSKSLASKGRQIQQKEERKSTRAKKAALRPRSWWLAEAQKWFNKFIRLRDANEMCISCDRAIEEIEGNDAWKIGGAWDCGHYLTRGAHPELRFEELNAFKQCKSCNAGSGKYTHKTKTVGEEYRNKLIKRIGIEKVEWIEGPHEPKKYTIDDLKELIVKYKKKCKEFE